MRPDIKKLQLATRQLQTKVNEMKIMKFIRLLRTVRNWPFTLIDHLHLTKADYLCRLRNGSSIEVRGGTNDRHIIFEVFVDHIYPFQISPRDTVIDIGAHVGCFTILAAKTGARVFSFEPFPPNFTVLEHNVRLNNFENVMIFNIAISGKRDNRELFLADNPTHTSSHSLHPFHFASYSQTSYGKKKLEVPCITLDDIILENNLDRIDLLKIDCEGCEYEILYEASVETLAKTKAIIIECEVFEKPSTWSIASLGKYLKNLGFNICVRGNKVYAKRPDCTI